MAQWLQMLLSNHEYPLNRLRIPQAPAVQFQWNWSSTLPSLGAQVHIQRERHTHTTLIYKKKREGALEDCMESCHKLSVHRVYNTEVGMVACACNPGTQEAEDC